MFRQRKHQKRCLQILIGFLWILLYSQVPSYAETEPKMDWEITVDLSQPQQGTAIVEMVLYQHQGERLFFRKMAPKSEIQFTDLEIATPTGQALKFRTQGKKVRLLKSIDSQTPLHLRYTVQPGGIGRHGHQGYISEDFASFDGRIFLMPSNMAALKNIRIRFRVPPAWQIITPHRQQQDWYYVDQFSKHLASKALLKSCLAFGQFDEHKQKFGNTEVGVYSFSKWADAHKKTITNKSVRMYQYFFEQFGFDPGVPFVIVWTPRSKQNQKIWSAVWSNGMCYEMPIDNVRNWELFAHRVAHPMHEYQPTGMSIRDQADHWFLEGWASYIEMIATTETGIVSKSERWDGLFREYLKTQHTSPDHDWPLIHEYKAKGKSTRFIHYIKSPLVMKMLDYHLRQNTGKNLEQFMKYAYGKYGNFQGNFPFLEELERFTGYSLQPFWNKMVRQPGIVIPVWREEDKIPQPFTPPSKYAITIDGEKIPGDYLFQIAQSGLVERYADLIQFIAQEIHRRRQLKEQSVILYPKALQDNLAHLSADTRLLLTQYEKLHLEMPVITNPTVDIDESTPDGKTFAQLLEAEKHYETQRNRHGVKTLRIKTRQLYRLGFSATDKLTLHTQWLKGGLNADFEVITPAGVVFQNRSMLIEPGWHNTYNHFSKKRDGQSGIWKFRILDNDQKILIERAFWQREKNG
jgi:hypothetical protein